MIGNTITKQLAVTPGKIYNNNYAFTFNLPTACNTSAGVYDSNNNLLKTIWNNVYYPAGSHTRYWDKLSDDGVLLENGTYTIQLLTNNVTYTWNGVVGNTSDNNSGSQYYASYNFPTAMAFGPTYGYLTLGYNEQQASCIKFAKDIPNTNLGAVVPNQGQQGYYCTTDANNVYWAGESPDSTSTYRSYIYATKMSDDSFVTFSSGTAFASLNGVSYPSVVGIQPITTGKIKGFTTQYTGDKMFLSRIDGNLYVYSKSTGALLQTIAFTSPTKLCIGGDDSLWIYSSAGLENYTVNSDGTLTFVKRITSLIAPQGMSVSTDGSYIVIADGGSSQQLKAFNVSDLSSKWVLGDLGGNLTTAIITNSRFCFNTSYASDSCVAFKQDGTFWVLDTVNSRFMHYDANLNYLEQIAYKPVTYTAHVDLNNPTRATCGWFEYLIDYSKSLAGQNGSWTLVRNWGPQIPSSAYTWANTYYALEDITTLSNGRVYFALNTTGTTFVVYECLSNGTLRATAATYTVASARLNSDGSLRAWSIASNVITFTKRTLSGFDVNGDPQWGSATTVATINRATTDPIGNSSDVRIKCFDITDGGVITSFLRDPVNGTPKYHLGGVKVGSTTSSKWVYRAAYETSANYNGDYPTEGSFDIGNSAHNYGSQAITLGRSIFWNYYGEGYKGTQANMWNHHYENGLMIGQFGALSTSNVLPVGPGVAGNSLLSDVVQVGSDYYVYHNDESKHAGLHRWQVSGLNTILIQSFPVTISETIQGLNTEYYNSTDLNNFRLSSHIASDNVNISIASITVLDANLTQGTSSVRWEGFVRLKYAEATTFYVASNGGVRLFVNNNLVINQWTNTTDTEFSVAVSLPDLSRYRIVIEYSNTNTSAKCILSWSSTSLTKEVIPKGSLYFFNKTYPKTNLPIIDSLLTYTSLESGLYGWTKSNTEVAGVIYSQTNSTKIGRFKANDVKFNYNYNTYSSFSFTRDLGNNTNLTNWLLTGIIQLPFNYANHTVNADGGWMEIWDSNNKVITKFYITQILPYPKETSVFNTKTINTTTLPDPNNFVDKGYSINAKNGVLSLVYGGYTLVSDTVFDTTAIWNNPSKLVFRFAYASFNYRRTFDISEMYFSKNQ